MFKYLRIIGVCLVILGISQTRAQAQEELEVTAGEPIGQEFVESIPIETETLEGRITEIVEQVIEPYDESQNIVFQTVQAEVTHGSLRGRTIQVEFNRTVAKGEPILQMGDKVLINSSIDGTGAQTFYIIDFVRSDALVSLFLIFVTLVLLVGLGHGLRSLLGLISSFIVIFSVILPGIQTGLDPIGVAITGAILIIGVTFYISHGFNEKTTWAVIGTIASLLATGILAHIFIDQAKLTGFGAEEVAFLQVLKSGQLNARGLLLAGIIIGALGVLDDITISQASIVRELKLANPKLKSRELFVRAMNVGRDHISSLVNTLILVYTGASLPLLLLFSIDTSRTAWDVINYEMVAEEIVHTLVGSIGLVLAVPITTALVAWFGFKGKLEPEKHGHSHHH